MRPGDRIRDALIGPLLVGMMLLPGSVPAGRPLCPGVSGGAFGAAARPVVLLSVFNYARVPPATLRSAENEVQRIFESAGIRLVWFNADELPADHLPFLRLPRAPRCFAVRIRRGDGRSGGASTRDVAGSVIEGGVLADVFYGTIRNHATVAQCPEGVLLGEVLAHEVAHLIIGNAHHGTVGVLAPRLGPSDHLTASQGRSRFDDQDADLLRRSLNDTDGH